MSIFCSYPKILISKFDTCKKVRELLPKGVQITFGFTMFSDVYMSFVPNKTSLTKYRLSQWISKLLGNFIIHWSRQYLVHFNGLVGIVHATVCKTGLLLNNILILTIYFAYFLEPPGRIWILVSTVYPKKYAHGFCFAVLCCGYTLTYFPISIRLTSLALCQSNDCPSASKATLMNMDKHFMWIYYEWLHNHNKAKHNKTVCIFLGIYCT